MKTLKSILMNKKLLDFDENLITDFYNKEKQIDGFNENSMIKYF